MNRWKSSIFLKFFLWIVFICSAAAASFSGALTVQVLAYNAYSSDDPLFYVHTEAYRELVQNTVLEALSYCEEEGFEILQSVYSEDRCNLSMIVYDSDSRMIAENYIAGGAAGYTEEVWCVLQNRAEVCVSCTLNKRFPAEDAFSELREHAETIRARRYGCAAVFAGSLLALIVSSVMMLTCAGHRKGSEEYILHWYDRIPFDLYTIGMSGIGVCLIAVQLKFISAYRNYEYFADYIELETSIAFTVLFLVMLYELSAARRIKAKTWLTNNAVTRFIMMIAGLIGSLCRWAYTLVSGLPHPLFTIEAYVLYWIVFVFFLVTGFWVLNAVMVVLGGSMMVYALYADAVIRSAQNKIASGETDVEINTQYLFGHYRRQAEEMMNIRDGISAAVEKQMQSERLKSELIANVSHDIKTPLTSIINYVDLLKNNDNPERTEEYLEVLSRNANRLKQLTTDIVEASRASTGNIEVHAESFAVNELIEQACGEFEDKVRASKLDLIITQPKEPLYVLADGRLLWRVLSNLLSNCCKYSMPGTRVYLDVDELDDQVLISLKNVSKEALNISAEELKQRFVRGDSSRHTEGSGLGLNIAESLVKLLNGSINLQIDGDLFKAFVSIPKGEAPLTEEEQA